MTYSFRLVVLRHSVARRGNDCHRGIDSGDCGDPVRLHETIQDFRQYARPLLMENKFRAVRYGLDGMLIDFGKQQEVPERDLIEDICSSSIQSSMSWKAARRSSTSGPF